MRREGLVRQAAAWRSGCQSGGISKNMALSVDWRIKARRLDEDLGVAGEKIAQEPTDLRFAGSGLGVGVSSGPPSSHNVGTIRTQDEDCVVRLRGTLLRGVIDREPCPSVYPIRSTWTKRLCFLVPRRSREACW